MAEVVCWIALRTRVPREIVNEGNTNQNSVIGSRTYLFFRTIIHKLLSPALRPFIKCKQFTRSNGRCTMRKWQVRNPIRACRLLKIAHISGTTDEANEQQHKWHGNGKNASIVDVVM